VAQYDLAVIGAGLGGLTAAALASKSKKKVVVLSPSDTVGGALGVHETKGFFFHAGPSQSYGFQRGGELWRLNETLGIAQNASLLSPCYQVALPDRRITIYAEQSETLDEHKREFPDEFRTIERFYHDVRKHAEKNSRSSFSAFLSASRSARSFLKTYRFSSQFTAFLDVQAYYFFHNSAAALTMNSLIALCDTAPLTVQGGFKKLSEQVADVLVKNGGEIRYGVQFDTIPFDVKTISTAEGPIQADAVVWNTGKTAAAPPLLCFGVRDEVAPVGMLSHVLFLPDYSRPAEFASLTLSSKDDESAAPRGMRALTAAFTASLPVENALNQVRSVIPFLDEFLLFSGQYTPAIGACPGLSKASLKPVGNRDSNDVLYRSSAKGIYCLFDGTGTPAQSAAAARWIMGHL
jgi:phytoene dehydrogenase-like protein